MRQPRKPPAAEAIEEIQRAVGPRITLMRRRAGLTLEELAGKTGFTKGYLSRIENARVMPPIATLVRIAHVLGLGVTDLLEAAAPAGDDDRVTFVPRSDAHASVHGEASFGYDYVALAAPRHGVPMTPFLMIFPEGIDKDARFHHEGDEFVYLLEGRVSFEIVVDGKPRYYLLEPGDSLCFDSTLPHHGRSVRGRSVALVVVAERTAHGA